MEPIIYRFYGDDDHYRDVFEDAMEWGRRGYTECDEIYISKDYATYYVFHNKILSEEKLEELVEQYKKEEKIKG
jgi:hypothetical protein